MFYLGANVFVGFIVDGVAHATLIGVVGTVLLVVVIKGTANKIFMSQYIVVKSI